MTSLVLQVLSEVLLWPTSTIAKLASELSSSYSNYCIRNNLRRPEITQKNPGGHVPHGYSLVLSS